MANSHSDTDGSLSYWAHPPLDLFLKHLLITRVFNFFSFSLRQIKTFGDCWKSLWESKPFFFSISPSESIQWRNVCIFSAYSTYSALYKKTDCDRTKEDPLVVTGSRWELLKKSFKSLFSIWCRRRTVRSLLLALCSFVSEAAGAVHRLHSSPAELTMWQALRGKDTQCPYSVTFPHWLWLAPTHAFKPLQHSQ